MFGARTAESTRDFEARTAAIHVTPTPNDLYDINEIKADSLWLSEIVEINEIAALRIVAIEFQSRPRSHLTGPLSTQDIANIQEATGLSNVQASSLLTSLNISPSLEAEHIWNDFNAQGARRQRLITTYLSDRRHFMMAADHLLSFIVHMKPENLGAEAEPMRQVLLRGVVGQHEDYGAFEQFVTPYLEMLPRLIERSQSCPALVSTLSSSVDLELDWATSFLSEVVHGMSMLFQILDSAGGLFASQDVVGRWWTLMDNYAFLDQLTGVSSRSPTLSATS